MRTILGMIEAGEPLLQQALEAILMRLSLLTRCARPLPYINLGLRKLD